MKNSTIFHFVYLRRSKFILSVFYPLLGACYVLVMLSYPASILFFLRHFSLSCPLSFGSLTSLIDPGSV
jgi:hypothetical protein